MPTLYEIDRTVEQLIEYGFAFDEDTGEVMFDSSQLDAVVQDRDKKLVACACWIKNQRALASAIREEERKLAKRRQSIEGRLDSFGRYLLGSVERYGGVEAPECSVGARKSSRIVIENPDTLPPEYTRTKTEPDKTAIKQAIKSGKDVPGAFIEEYSLLRVS